MPHPRTLRKAREQVMWMVKDGFSTRRIRNYLHLWTAWWVKTTTIWRYETLLEWFIESCWQLPPAAIAEGLRQQVITSLNRSQRANVGLDTAQAV